MTTRIIKLGLLLLYYEYREIIHGRCMIKGGSIRIKERIIDDILAIIQGIYKEIAYDVSDIMYDPFMTAKKWQPWTVTSEFVQCLTHSMISPIFATYFH